MSIEKELLKRVKAGDDDGDFFISHRLYNDIETFLDQPEQDLDALKKDWVNFGYTAGKREQLLAQPEQEHVGIVRTIGGYPDNSEHIVEWLCKYRDLKEGDRLYLAPPKRERLSDEEVRAKYRDIALDNPLYVPSYYAGFRDAERAHGIGGGE